MQMEQTVQPLSELMMINGQSGTQEDIEEVLPNDMEYTSGKCSYY